jgi:ribosomal protein L12E/L44/L45/RPP1/RPP2
LCLWLAYFDYLFMCLSGVITSIGGEADEAAITQLIAELEGKSAADLVTEGMEKLKSCTGGGGGGASTGGDAPAAATAAAVVEKPKEEEVDALAGGMDMFGGEGGGGDY